MKIYTAKEKQELEEYKALIRKRLGNLKPIFAHASLGNFERDVALYEEEDEFTETYIGVQVMLEVIRNQIQELTELNAELRTTIEELKKEISLRKDYERRKDEFIAVLGHELRNPLAPIIYATEILKMQSKGKEPARTTEGAPLAVIERQSKHLSRLIQDLLDVSRIMQGKIELERNTTDLSEAVKNALETVRHIIEEQRHSVYVNLPSEKINLPADQMRLEQIMVNILNNAAKYTPKGGTISLTLSKDKECACISIEDSGVGIPKDALPHIFDLFAQGDQNKTVYRNGLGVGLMIARSLAKLHSGDVIAESDGPGRGSKFTIKIPLLKKTRKEKQNTGGKKNLSEDSVKNGDIKKKVLIVDDNIDLADSIGHIFKSYGQDVKITYSGKEALDSIEDFRPEIVLLDIAMPDMDGYTVVKKLRAHPVTKSANMVALTGFGQPGDKEKALAAGFNAHMIKPIGVQDLLNLLKS